MKNELVIDYAISTVPRAANYIYKLLPHIRSGAPIKLFVGTDDAAYLERYRRDPFVRIEKPARAEWLRFRNSSVFHRATWNYWRCMSGWPDDPRRHGLVILEDDVLPAKGWQQWLRRTIEEIQANFGSRYALALYTGRNYSKQAGGKGFVPYPIHHIAGTQGFYYPETIRKDCADFLKQYGVEWNEAPYDMLVADYLSRRDFPAFVTVPALIQHMGQISTGLSGFHQAPTFKPSLS